MSYTPIYNRPYPDGWEPWEISENTPFTVDVADQYDDTFENIEDYLANDLPDSLVPDGGTVDQVLTKNAQGKAIWANAQGGGGGTSNYNDLQNLPKINGTEIKGELDSGDLGLVNAEAGKGLSTNDFSDTDKQKLDNLTQVTKQDVTSWGFYEKPTNGIPENDLSEEVQQKLDSTYNLPIASDTVLGGIKVGNNLNIDNDGKLNATASGGTNVVNKTWDEYKDLPEPVKNNGDIYNITDAPETLAKPYDEEKEGGYRAGEYCQHDLGFYRCVKPTSGTWDASAWKLTDVGEELYSIKRGGQTFSGVVCVEGEPTVDITVEEVQG